MAIQLQKNVFIDYFNDDWYADIYYYYTNQQFLIVDQTYYAVIKKQA